MQDVRPSIQSTVAWQERKALHQRARIDKYNDKVVTARESEDDFREKHGYYDCRYTDKLTGRRCCSTFTTTPEARDRHEGGSSPHELPTHDLKSWLHEMHLKGNYAFSLACGTIENQSAFIMKDRNLTETVVMTSEPKSCDFADDRWFKDGCYRKHRKDQFRASKELINDLEALWMEGFQTDGEKQGKNKYTPEQALVYLKNLKKENGRRKYSYAHGNKENGPLPTKQYIQGWFGRRKNKLAEEEKARKAAEARRQNVRERATKHATEREESGFIHDERWNDLPTDDETFVANDQFGFDSTISQNEKCYKKKKISDLKDLVCRRLNRGTGGSRFSKKAFLIATLKHADFLSAGVSSLKNYQNKTTEKLLDCCLTRNLLADKDSLTTVSSFARFLSTDDRVRAMRQNKLQMKKVIDEHDYQEEEMGSLLL